MDPNKHTDMCTYENQRLVWNIHVFSVKQHHFKLERTFKEIYNGYVAAKSTGLWILLLLSCTY